MTRVSRAAGALAIVAIASAWAGPAFAQADAGGPALEVTAAALDLLERAGRALDGKRFAEAAGLYRRAAALQPDEGQPLVLAGVAAYQIPAPTAARGDLRRALARSLGEEDRDLAQLYLGLIAEDLAASRAPTSGGAFAGGPDGQPWSAGATATIGGGFDSNVRQAAPGSLEADGPTGVPTQAAVYGTVAVELMLGRSFDGGGRLDASYAVEQTAHGDRQFGDLDFQAHVVTLEFAQPWGESFEAALAATGDLSFTGAGTELLPFQRSLRLDPQLTLGGRALRVRLAGAWQQTSTLDPAFSFLSGRRLEVSLTPQLTVAGWRASLMGRLRHDALGTATAGRPAPDDLCPDCAARTETPYANRSFGAIARLAAPFGWRLRPALSARWDLRRFDQAQRTLRQGPFGIEELDARTRGDTRLGLGGSLGLRLTRACTLTARYDHLRLWSNDQQVPGPGCPAGAACAAPDGASRSYKKHGLTLDLTIDWS